MLGKYYHLLINCSLAFLFIGCVAAELSYTEEQIVKIRTNIADTKFALNTALKSVAFGLEKYELGNELPAKFLTNVEAAESEQHEFFQLFTKSVLKLAEHLLREEVQTGKKPTKFSQLELAKFLVKYLQENVQKAEVKKSAHFLMGTNTKFQSEKLMTARAEESTKLLFFYHFFLWEIYANVAREEKGGEFLKALQKCPALNQLNQHKREIAYLIYNGPLTAIKRQLLLGTPNTAGGIDFRNMLNVAIQASVFPFVKDRRERREIDLYCRAFYSSNKCFSVSKDALEKSNWKMTDGMLPEVLLTEMETEMAKWLQGENLAFLLGLLNGRLRAELAHVHNLSGHWKSDKKRTLSGHLKVDNKGKDALFPVFFLLARFYRHLAEEIWRRFMHSPQTVEFEDVGTGEMMEIFVRQTLADNREIFTGNDQMKEKENLRMKLMVVGPEILSIQKKVLSPNGKVMVLEDNLLEKAMEALRGIGQLNENGHFCKKLAIVIIWIAAWELKMSGNVPEKLEMMKECEQKMAIWNEEFDESKCLKEISEFSDKLVKIIKPERMTKGNAKFLNQILNKSTDERTQFDFTEFFTENYFYIKIARLLIELHREMLSADDIEAETLAILEEINSGGMKMHKFMNEKEKSESIVAEFLKMLASAIDHYETRIFNLKITRQLAGEWKKEQENCLNKLVSVLARIVAMEKIVLHLNSQELRAELGYLVKDLAVMKATIQTAFPSKKYTAKEVLESAVRVRKALDNFIKNRGNLILEKVLAMEYTEFARRLERIDRIQRDMFGRFDLDAIEKIIRKVENSDGFDAKILEVALELLRAHKQSNAKQFSVIKFRGVDHMSISVGLIEYDFTFGGPRRKKFRDDVAQLTSTFSPYFAFPKIQWGMVEVGKADKIFYEMVKAGWQDGTYGVENRRCRTFAYVFICRLFNGKCPPQVMWPKNFLDLNHAYVPQESVFAMSARLIENERKGQEKRDDRCELKEHRIEFQIQIGMPEEGTSQTPHMPMPIGKMLPPIVQYKTRKFVGFNAKGKFIAEKGITMVQVYAKELAEKPEQIFEATLMVYVCKSAPLVGSFSSSEHAVIQKFGLRDHTNSFGFKSDGFETEFDLLGWKQSKTIKIIGIKTSKEEEDDEDL